MEERDVLRDEENKRMNVTLEKFGTLDSSEKTIATLGD